MSSRFTSAAANGKAAFHLSRAEGSSTGHVLHHIPFNRGWTLRLLPYLFFLILLPYVWPCWVSTCEHSTQASSSCGRRNFLQEQRSSLLAGSGLLAQWPPLLPSSGSSAQGLAALAVGWAARACRILPGRAPCAGRRIPPHWATGGGPCFHTSSIESNMAMSMRVQVSLQDSDFIFTR